MDKIILVLLFCCQNDISATSLLQLFVARLWFNLTLRMHFYMVILIRKSKWSNFLNLLIRWSHHIWYVVFVVLVHGLGVFGLSSNNLEWYKVMLIILCFIVILPKNISASLYMWMKLLIQAVIKRVLSNLHSIVLNIPDKRSRTLEIIGMLKAKLLAHQWILVSNLYLTKENCILFQWDIDNLLVS